jgi:hypothetical protein
VDTHGRRFDHNAWVWSKTLLCRSHVNWANRSWKCSVIRCLCLCLYGWMVRYSSLFDTQANGSARTTYASDYTVYFPADAPASKVGTLIVRLLCLSNILHLDFWLGLSRSIRYIVTCAVAWSCSGSSRACLRAIHDGIRKRRDRRTCWSRASTWWQIRQIRNGATRPRCRRMVSTSCLNFFCHELTIFNRAAMCAVPTASLFPF